MWASLSSKCLLLLSWSSIQVLARSSYACLQLSELKEQLSWSACPILIFKKTYIISKQKIQIFESYRNLSEVNSKTAGKTFTKFGNVLAWLANTAELDSLNCKYSSNVTNNSIEDANMRTAAKIFPKFDRGILNNQDSTGLSFWILWFSAC